MNIEILTVEEPSATLCAFVQEADTFVERLGRLILAVNRELYARQTSLSRFGDCGLNERLAYSFASFFGDDPHAENSNV